MARSIRAIQVLVDGQLPRVVRVENTGPALGKLVGGFLEVFYIPTLTTDPMNSIIGLCDEEGWLKDNPRLNPYAIFLHERAMLAGDLLLVRAQPNGEFGDLTHADLQSIERLLGPILYPTGAA